MMLTSPGSFMHERSEKEKALRSMLDQGLTLVHLDARVPGVVVPERFREDAHLRLNLSWRFGLPDFTINDFGVRATLSFGGLNFSCAIPWGAVFGMTSHATGRTLLFPEDVPDELLDAAPPASAPQPREDAPPPPPELSGKRRGHLRLVK
jgi:stringent starvation protein B